MDNVEKYAEILAGAMMIDRADVESASAASLPAWDSIGKLTMVAAIEEAFSIELEAEDIIQFNSYTDGLAILKKYGVEL